MIGNLHSYKNGTTVSNGYIKVHNKIHPHRQSDNYVLKHRLVIEKVIGRYLKPKEVTHHINGNKKDNRKKNLMCFVSQKAHIKFEKWGDYNTKEVIFDGRNYKKENKYGLRS